MIAPTIRSLSISFVAVLAFGCGDDDASSDGGGTDAVVDAGGPPTFPELEALDTTPDSACAGTWVAGVTGRIVNQRGESVLESFPQMCVRVSDGNFNCLGPEQARDDGYFGQVISEESRCMDELNFRVFALGDSYGTTYCHADLSPVDGILTVADPLVLYDVLPPTDLPPEGDPEAVRTVTFAGGLEVDVKPAPLFGLYEELGAARVEEETCFADSSFDGLWAFAAEARTFRSDDSPAGFNFRIPTELPNGTAVDLFVLGGLDELELATGTRLLEGAFERFGTGMVVDGMVVNDAGSELPVLSWLGFRAQ